MKSPKNGLIATISGTVVVIICCFPPVLVILLGTVGLSAFTPYIDMVLLPALGIMIVLTIFSYLRWRKAVKKIIYHKAELVSRKKTVQQHEN